MRSNRHAQVDEEWEIIADLLTPGIERILLAGEEIPASHVRQPEPVVENPRPLPPERGRKVREQWVIDYLRFSESAARKEMVEASGLPNSTMGRLLKGMLADGRLNADGTTNDRVYRLR